MKGIATASLTRRNLLGIMGAATATAALGFRRTVRAAELPAAQAVPGKGRIKQAITLGCLRGLKSLDDAAQVCVRLGIKGIDFVAPNEFPVLKQHGLICTMVKSGNLTAGFNHTENHAAAVESLRKGIDAAAAAGFPNVICFSGNRQGLDDETGLKNCAQGLKQVVGYAEEKGVTVCMELLNSKRNHKDYQCDHTAWGVELCKRVGSPRFKLLYDIYHMQVMEGDISATLRENIAHIGHIHTAGVPGRNEIDDTQELYYPAIMRAIADAGYTGYVAHEYSPKRDPAASLEQAVRICDV